MSSLLSLNTEIPSPTGARASSYVPFTAHIRLVPNLGNRPSERGKRDTLNRNLQKAARRIQQSIENAIDDGITPELNIATPVAYTPQFGDFTARVTIVGFYEVNRRTLNAAQTTSVDEIHSGTDQGEQTALYDVNKGGSLAAGQDPLPGVDAEVTSLRQALADALNPLINDGTGPAGTFGALISVDLIDIVHIEYNGIKYGVKQFGGRSFPQ